MPEECNIFLTVSKIDWFKFGKTQLLFFSFRWVVQHQKWKVLVTQSCLTICDPTDCNMPGSSVHRLLQARILEWIAVRFSRGFSWPRHQTRVSCIAGRLYLRSHKGSPEHQRHCQDHSWSLALSQKTSKFKKKCYQLMAWKTEFLFKYFKCFIFVEE